MRTRSLLIALLLLCAPATPAAERVLTVFAASSLSDVMEQIGRAYTASTAVPVRFSFAASSALARQVESGAPADVFISADQEWMDHLAARNLIRRATRVDVVGNALVLVAPADSRVQLRIAPGFALGAALGRSGRLSTGDPATVPVGRYAKEALMRLKVWETVSSRLIPADNVRAALNFVALGEAPLGIVYATDARGNAKVRVVDTFPSTSHARIRYPAAVTANGAGEAAGFVQFLRGEAARALFEAAGFTP